MMRIYRLRLAFLGLAISALISGHSQSQVSYSVIDSIYTQDFDSLPNTPQNTSLGASPLGWTDNNAAPAVGNFSIPGWYLFHNTTQAEGGANGNQRMRIGAGTATTGAFMSFGASGSTERALGAVGANTLVADNGNMFIGLRLVNDTGIALSGFQITFDGEQWRNAGLNAAETMLLSYSLSADESNWRAASTPYDLIVNTSFSSPVVSATAGAVDGNTDGLVADITGYVTDISWNPGAELWLRWADLQRPGADDGMAIDNVRFTAGNSIVNPNVITSVMTGPSSSPGTWSNNLAPDPSFIYHVVSGHTVTVDAVFAGAELRATSGGTVNFDSGGSGLYVPSIVVNAGGDLTVNASGNFYLGDIFAPALGRLVLNEDVAFNIDPGAEFGLDMILDGTGNIDFNTGAGSLLILTNAAGHDGTIRFNGTGDQVRLTENASTGFGTLEMNSTGANTLFINPGAGAGAGEGVVVFDQPGTVDHASTSNRLQGLRTIVANEAVTVDLSKDFAGNERRWLLGTSTEGLQGSADIAVNGTATDPSNGADITVNEFEVGSTGQPGTVIVDSYSGTLTANNYVNVEIRHHMPNAKFVVNDKASLDMGHQVLISNHSIQFGEIEVNSGGTLDVGFSQQASTGVTGHHVYQLTLTAGGSRDGDLTLNDGATLNMQINRTATDTVFDTIVADGDVKLDGTLNVLVNALASSGAAATTAYAGQYTPTVGDKFDIISINSQSPVGDYDGNTTVGPEDYGVWQGEFGLSNPAADGNLDGIVNAADFVLWRDNLGATGVAGGTITGTFDNLVVMDFDGVMAGFAFQVNYSSSLVQLEVIAAPPGSGTAVPEPSSVAMACVVILLAGLHRCFRRRN